MWDMPFKIFSVFSKIFLFFADSYRKRLYLAKAIYYHAKISQESIEKYDFGEIRKEIEEDAAYTPLVVRSFIVDELTYSQTIEAMECLDGSEEEETVIISYFHNHVNLRSLLLVFNSDFVRDSWPQERKRKLLKKIVKSADDMHDCAGRTTEVLKKVLKRKLMGFQTWTATEGSQDPPAGTASG